MAKVKFTAKIAGENSITRNDSTKEMAIANSSGGAIDCPMDRCATKYAHKQNEIQNPAMSLIVTQKCQLAAR